MEFSFWQVLAKFGLAVDEGNLGCIFGAMEIAVFSPYSLTSPKGNTITTQRLVSLLGNLGCSAVAVDDSASVGTPDVLIALHATRSLSVSREYKSQRLDGQLWVYLTGTDVYAADQSSADLAEALGMADVIMVSQSAIVQSLAEEFRDKCAVIPASVFLPELPQVIDSSSSDSTKFGFVGHLREVKNPFLMNRAMQLCDGDLTAVTMGAELEPGFQEQVEEWQQRDPRFRYLGNVPHAEALARLSQLDYSINSSFSEGGANAVAESIVLGIPVLASRIEGNLGLLGEEYVGYYEGDNARSLADLMARVMQDQSFARELRQQTEGLAEYFAPRREQEALAQLLQSS